MCLHVNPWRRIHNNNRGFIKSDFKHILIIEFSINLVKSFEHFVGVNIMLLLTNLAAVFNL